MLGKAKSGTAPTPFYRKCCLNGRITGILMFIAEVTYENVDAEKGKQDDGISSRSNTTSHQLYDVAKGIEAYIVYHFSDGYL